MLFHFYYGPKIHTLPENQYWLLLQKSLLEYN